MNHARRPAQITDSTIVTTMRSVRFRPEPLPSLAMMAGVGAGFIARASETVCANYAPA